MKNILIIIICLCSPYLYSKPCSLCKQSCNHCSRDTINVQINQNGNQKLIIDSSIVKLLSKEDKNNFEGILPLLLTAVLGGLGFWYGKKRIYDDNVAKAKIEWIRDFRNSSSMLLENIESYRSSFDEFSILEKKIKTLNGTIDKSENELLQKREDINEAIAQQISIAGSIMPHKEAQFDQAENDCNNFQQQIQNDKNNRENLNKKKDIQFSKLQDQATKIEKYKNELSLFLYDENSAEQHFLIENLKHNFIEIAKNKKAQEEVFDNLKSGIINLSSSKWKQAQGKKS